MKCELSSPFLIFLTTHPRVELPRQFICHFLPLQTIYVLGTFVVGIDYRMQEIRNVRDALFNFKPDEDGTYEFLTHRAVEYSTGYQVSFVRPEAFEQLSNEEWDILTLYCCVHMQSDAHIGVYEGSAEISFHCMDFPKAEKIMYEFNQESILDWKEKEAFPEDFIRWLIFNPKYDENIMVNYHEVLERVQ